MDQIILMILLNRLDNVLNIDNISMIKTLEDSKPPIWGVGGLNLRIIKVLRLKFPIYGVGGVIYLGLISSLMLLFFSSCTKQSGDHLFTLLKSSTTHADFNNKLDYDTQLNKKFNVYTFRNFYNGAG